VRILYDHQIFDSQLFGGISRYHVELLRHLRETPGTSATLAAAFSNNAYLQELSPPRPRRFFPGVRALRKGGHLTWLNRRASLAALRRGDFDLFHPTSYDPWFLPHLGGRPHVVTVHDMVHELFPGLFAAADPTAGWKAAQLRGAARIIAISDHTRRDLVRLHDVDPARITVIHHATAPLAPPGAPRPPGLPARYLLFVGQRGGYKNFLPWLEAIAPLLQEDPALGVVCAGWRPFREPERSAMARLGIEGQLTHLPAVDDATLGALYQHAAAFAFPSRYEGFGIPMLEAFQAGCPVLAAGASSLPEVGGAAAAWFDPEDAASMREVTAGVLRDASLRRRLAQRGAERVKAFSWARAAAETRVCYEAALSAGATGAMTAR
jgi:glycosyltransferase involved in cell wall biosynthesis